MNSYLIAAALVFTAAGCVSLFLLYKSDKSQRRLRRMLRQYELDPGMLDEHDYETIAKGVRHRCQKCHSEGACERWLDGKQPGNNDFCPNAPIFQELKEYLGSESGARVEEVLKIK